MSGPTSSVAPSSSTSRRIQRLQTAVGGVGIAAALAVAVHVLPGTGPLWFHLLLAVLALWVTAPCRLELASGIGTVTIGVWIGILAFLIRDSAPFAAALIWVAAVTIVSLITRKRLLYVFYATGLAALGALAFAAITSIAPREGLLPLLIAVPAVAAYMTITLSAEWLFARIALSTVARDASVGLRPARLLIAFGLNVGLCIVAWVASGIAEIRVRDIGEGLTSQSIGALLVVSVALLCVSQYLRRIRVERKLAGLIEGALALPWGESPMIFAALQQFARSTVLAASVRIDEHEGRPFELSAPIQVPGRPTQWIVLTRRQDSGGFTELEQRTLLALAHMASQALYDRRISSSLRTQVATDELTGLANSRGLQDAFTASAGGELALLYMDLDNFKLINDGYGHGVGDRVLEIVASRIRSSLRIEDVAARLGGDEFAVIVSANSAWMVGRRITASVEQPLSLDHRTFLPRISVGRAERIDGRPFSVVLSEADKNMYEAKKARKAAPATVQHDLRDAEVVRAVQDGRIDVFYQPVVDVAQAEIVGFEALIRFATSDGEVVEPRVIVDIAADSGLLDVLTASVLASSLEQMVTFRKIVPSLEVLHFNIEAEQLQSDQIVHLIQAARAQYPEFDLCLELTEGSLQGLDDAGSDRLLRLKRADVVIALDDYGQQYAAAAALAAVPLDIVKVDRFFLADSDNERAQIVLRGVVSMISELGLQCLVEGVETAAAHELVRVLAVRRAQGFYYGRPASASDTVVRLRVHGHRAVAPPH